MPSTFLESTTPGKHFSVSVYKPQRGPAVAYASEGIVEYREDGTVCAFTSEVFGADRIHRVPLSGPATAKNKTRALCALQDDLEDKGWIVKGQVLSLDF